MEYLFGDDLDMLKLIKTPPPKKKRARSSSQKKKRDRSMADSELPKRKHRKHCQEAGGYLGFASRDKLMKLRSAPMDELPGITNKDAANVRRHLENCPKLKNSDARNHEPCVVCKAISAVAEAPQQPKLSIKMPTLAPADEDRVECRGKKTWLGLRLTRGKRVSEDTVTLGCLACRYALKNCGNSSVTSTLAKFNFLPRTAAHLRPSYILGSHASSGNHQAALKQYWPGTGKIK